MKVPQPSSAELDHLAQIDRAIPMLRYAITDRRLWGESEADQLSGLVQQARRLAAVGVDYLQLREKDLPSRRLAALTRDLLLALRSPEASGKQVRLLVNSRVDVAAATGAAGVHLPSGEGELTPAQARLILDRDGSSAKERSIVSVSCHTVAEVERACGRTADENGADFVLFGPVFGKSVRGEPVMSAVGLDALAAACTAAGSVPVLALGGVTVENARECIAAGAAGVAGIRLFL